MHPELLQLAPSDPGSELCLDLSDAGGGQAGIVVHPRAQDFRPLPGKSFLLGLGEELENVLSGVEFFAHRAMVISLCIAERETAANPRSLFHLFAAWPLRARGEAKIRKRASNGRRLGVFETCNRIYVAVPLSFRCPACRGGESVEGGPIHESPEGEFAIASSNELSVDAALRIARIKQLYPLSDG